MAAVDAADAALEAGFFFRAGRFGLAWVPAAPEALVALGLEDFLVLAPVADAAGAGAPDVPGAPLAGAGAVGGFAGALLDMEAILESYDECEGVGVSIRQ
jgi:hypothetical protein